MECKHCRNKAVFNRVCKEHFINGFERKFKKTISAYRMLPKNARVCAAVSGGKDSLTLLYLLSRHCKSVLAIAVDEGIKGYREHTLKDFEDFCKQHKIQYKIVSFKKEFGKTLDEMVKSKKNPCTICGEKRRLLLNKYAEGHDVLATGHNMDDQAQAALMNLFKANFSLMPNLLPKSKRAERFVQRIKPLYWHSEQEIKAYAFLKGIKAGFAECPYVENAFRNHMRRLLNEHEAEHPGTKKSVLKQCQIKNFKKGS